MTMTLSEKVDAYIDTKAQIKALEERAEALAADFKALGACKLAGSAGSVEVSEVAGRKTTDWKLVCAAANVPTNIVDKYSKIGLKGWRVTMQLPV